MEVLLMKYQMVKKYHDDLAQQSVDDFHAVASLSKDDREQHEGQCEYNNISSDVHPDQLARMVAFDEGDVGYDWGSCGLGNEKFFPKTWCGHPIDRAWLWEWFLSLKESVKYSPYFFKNCDDYKKILRIWKVVCFY